MKPHPKAQTLDRSAKPHPALRADHKLGEPADQASTELRIVSVAELPSRFGTFRAVAFAGGRDAKEHLAIVHGVVRGKSRVPVRVHSECLTGDVMGSLRCDCRDQLTAALETIGHEPAGIVLYLRQEGRGIGLTNKIRAYALQDRGYDTIDANRMLGFGDDEREYGAAAAMLRVLGVKSVLLMTNNPSKIEGLRHSGVKVSGRMPLIMPPNPHNSGYLRTKQERAGHWLGIASATGTDGAPTKNAPQPKPARVLPLTLQGEPT
jgi:GTP cyclohydrolase II